METIIEEWKEERKFTEERFERTQKNMAEERKFTEERFEKLFAILSKSPNRK